MINLYFTSATYKLKEGTKTSYYLIDGDVGLPKRIGITDNEFAATRANDRHGDKKIGQIKGTFTKDEESPYKVSRPYNIHSNIWYKSEYPEVFGWGTLGYSVDDKKTKDDGDVILIKFPEVDKSIVWIYLFKNSVVCLEECYNEVILKKAS